MSEIATSGARSVDLVGQNLDLNGLMEVSRVMAASNLLPQALRGKAADVFITIMYGQELGMTPMQSVLGIYVVNGRPGLSGQTWMARIRQAGHRAYVPCSKCGLPKAGHGAEHLYVADHDDKHCTITIERGDTGDEHSETFTWADAERAKLTGKDVWKAWPKRMLLWRATTNCATVICPEVALGFELQGAEPMDVEPKTLATVAAEREDRRAEPEIVVEPEPAEPSAEELAELAEIAATVTPAADDQLLPDDPDLFAGGER